MGDTKKCYRCKQVLPITDFHNSYTAHDGLQGKCHTCNKESQKEWKHRTGKQKPMSENKQCSSYMGVYVAERLLEKVFRNVIKMPYAHPGYDFVCGKGFKIDVKCCCKKESRNCQYGQWTFCIKRNRVPDYFAFLAFDNRDDLTPLHFWIIPESVVNDLPPLGRLAFCISESKANLQRLSQYEHSIDKIVDGCNLLRVGNDND
jgi:hypothetical protein